MLPDRIRRGDNRRHRKFAEEVFRIRYVAHDHVALHRHVSHDQPPLAKRGKDLLRNGSVGLPERGKPTYAKTLTYQLPTKRAT